MQAVAVGLCIIALAAAAVDALSRARRDRKAGHDWSEWRPEVRHNGLRWINGKTGEVLTPEEMDRRACASVIVWGGKQ